MNIFMSILGKIWGFIKRFFLFIEMNSFWVIVATLIIVAICVIGWKYTSALTIIIGLIFIIVILSLTVYFNFLTMVNRFPMSITVLIVIYFLAGLLKAAYEIITKTSFAWLIILVVSAIFLAILNGVIDKSIAVKERAEIKAEKDAEKKRDDEFHQIFLRLKSKKSS